MLGLNSINLYDKTKQGESVSVIPQMRISAMDNPLQGFNFVVTLNEFTFGFKSVSGLTVRKATDEIVEGGVNDHKLLIGSSASQLSSSDFTLTFKRGISIRSPMFISEKARAIAASIPNNAARKAALLGVSALDPQEALENGPAVGIIQVYNRQMKLHSLYSFLSLGMIEWKSDDLDATSSDVLCEEITIAHTGLMRHPVTLIPQMYNAVTSAVSDYKKLHDTSLKHNKVKEAKEKEKAAKDLEDKKSQELELKRKQEQEKKELEEEKERLKQLELELQNES